MALPDLARLTLDRELPTKQIRRRAKGRRATVLNLAEDTTSTFIEPQPFLKWAGGKRALLGEIRLRTPNFEGTYIEPFLGAGAVLFDQDRERSKIVSDYNSELIDVYETIRDHPQLLINELRTHVNTEEHYYEVRAWDRTPDFAKRSKIQRAARFIFLNKTNYNGLYRVNAAGQMNVPFGGQSNPDWIQEDVLLSVSDFLNVRDEDDNLRTTLMRGDYRLALKHAKPGDWVYLDPPYAETFTHYQSGGFTTQDQTDLRDEILALTRRGVPVLMSNSDVELIRDLYQDRSVFEIDTVVVRRAIGATTSSRGNVNEVMVSNFPGLGR